MIIYWSSDCTTDNPFLLVENTLFCRTILKTHSSRVITWCRRIQLQRYTYTISWIPTKSQDAFILLILWCHFHQNNKKKRETWRFTNFCCYTIVCLIAQWSSDIPPSPWNSYILFYHTGKINAPRSLKRQGHQGSLSTDIFYQHLVTNLQFTWILTIYQPWMPDGTTAKDGPYINQICSHRCWWKQHPKKIDVGQKLNPTETFPIFKHVSKILY